MHSKQIAEFSSITEIADDLKKREQMSAKKLAEFDHTVYAAE